MSLRAADGFPWLPGSWTHRGRHFKTLLGPCQGSVLLAGGLVRMDFSASLTPTVLVSVSQAIGIQVPLKRWLG